MEWKQSKGKKCIFTKAYMSCSMKSCGATNMQKENMIKDIKAITETEDITERTPEDLVDSVSTGTPLKNMIFMH